MADLAGGTGAVYAGVTGIVAGVLLFSGGMRKYMSEVRAQVGCRTVEAQRAPEKDRVGGAHGSLCAYEFPAHGKTFAVWTDQCTGDSVAVRYIPSDPSRSSIVQERPLLTEGAAFAFLGLATIGVGFYILRGDNLAWVRLRRRGW